MQSINSINLHRFGEGLLVEVVGQGVNDDIIVRSFELDVIDPESQIVRPRSPLAAGEINMFEDALVADGYRVESAQAATQT